MLFNYASWSIIEPFYSKYAQHEAVGCGAPAASPLALAPQELAPTNGAPCEEVS